MGRNVIESENSYNTSPSNLNVRYPHLNDIAAKHHL